MVPSKPTIHTMARLTTASGPSWLFVDQRETWGREINPHETLIHQRENRGLACCINGSSILVLLQCSWRTSRKVRLGNVSIIASPTSRALCGPSTHLGRARCCSAPPNWMSSSTCPQEYTPNNGLTTRKSVLYLLYRCSR